MSEQLSIEQTLAFFRSAIASGERWSATCDAAYEEAMREITALRADVARLREDAARKAHDAKKIVQISAMCHAGSDQTSPYYGVVALCNDGSVWDGMWNNGQHTWTQLPSITQQDAARAAENTCVA